MNRDELAALCRAALTLAVGAPFVLLHVLLVGWWPLAMLVASGVVWCVTVERWRLW